MDFISIMKIKSDSLECFVKVIAQDYLTEKWKPPTKGNEKKLKKEKCTHKLDKHF